MKKINIDIKIKDFFSNITKRSALIGCSVLLVALTGCNDEEFLDQANPNQISTDVFWQTAEHLEGGLNAVYNTFKSTNLVSLVEELNRSDIAYAGSWRARPTMVNTSYLQTFNNASNPAIQKWQEGYKGVFRANQVIEAANRIIPTLSGEDKIRAVLALGQARLLRGFFYYNLYNSYNGGSIPLITEVAMSPDDFFKAPSPADQVRAFYIADFEYAAEALKDANWTGEDLGRVTAGAATALLGNTYLHNSEYAKAAEKFKSVIEDFGYSLMPNIGSNFTTMDEFNSESILEASFTVDYKMSELAWSWKLLSSNLAWAFSPNWLATIPSNWLTVLYRNEVKDLSDDANRLEDGSFRKYSLRTSASVALVDDVDSPWYGDLPGTTGPFNQGNTSYWRKHTNWDIVEAEKDIYPSTPRSGVNERYIRLAGVMLNYAECLVELGDLEESMKYVNKVRRRSAVQLIGPNGSGEFPANDHDNITYTQDMLREHIRHVEKPLELGGEGLGERNIDLIRWGIKKERFQELSSRRYDALHYYDAVNDAGNSITRWASLLVEVPVDDPEVDPNFTEFQEGAANYTEEAHAYWPIPNTELVTNPFIGDETE